jgi:UDP-glucose 4-epimerase
MIGGRKLFITGGAGFIASHLIERLLDQHRITIYDNLHRNAVRFTNLARHPNLTFIQGDVLDAEKLAAAMTGSDVCVHAAAIAGIYSVAQKPTLTMKVNFLGAYHALEGAVRNGVRRFLDFSTSEVYGPFVYRGKESDETTLGKVGEKRWVYAVSKLASEHFAHCYHEEHGLAVTSVRPFNVYGPRQIGEGAIQQMVRQALRNEDITVFNDGTQIRSWCYVGDFVDGLVQALSREGAENEVFNLGNPLATITVLGLAQTIVRMTGSRSRIVFRPHPGPEVEMRVPDISKARELLGYDPKVGLEEGLGRCIEWYREHLDT